MVVGYSWRAQDDIAVKMAHTISLSSALPGLSQPQMAFWAGVVLTTILAAPSGVVAGRTPSSSARHDRKSGFRANRTARRFHTARVITGGYQCGRIGSALPQSSDVSGAR